MKETGIMPREEITLMPPDGDIRVCVHLNKADHERIKKLAAQHAIPGAGRNGAVSAFFRHLERCVIEDWE